MYKFLVLLYILAPSLSTAEDGFPLEFSIFSSKSSTYFNELVFEQQKSQFRLGSELELPFKIENLSPPHGDLLFNHYQQQLNFALFDQQAGQNSNTSVELHYLHLGSSYPVFKNKDFYFKTGFGLTYFSAPQRDFDEEVKLSMNVGIYRDYYISKNASMQFATRVYGTFMGAGGFSVNGINCQIHCDNSSQLWLQKEISLTFSYKF